MHLVSVADMVSDTRAGKMGALFALFLAAQVLACSGSGAPSCPNDLPASCPDPEPLYGDDVAPILAERCVPCHRPGGPQSSPDFTTYQGVFAQSGAILRQVFSCRMPPGGADPLEPEERETLLAWLACGAKDD